MISTEHIDDKLKISKKVGREKQAISWSMEIEEWISSGCDET